MWISNRQRHDHDNRGQFNLIKSCLMELRIASKIWTEAWWFMLIEKWHMYMREKTMNKGKVDGSKDLQPKANVIFVSIHSCHRQDITTEMGFCWTYHVCDIYIYTLNMKFISEKKKKRKKKRDMWKGAHSLYTSIYSYIHIDTPHVLCMQ